MITVKTDTNFSNIEQKRDVAEAQCVVWLVEDEWSSSRLNRKHTQIICLISSHLKTNVDETKSELFCDKSDFQLSGLTASVEEKKIK